MDCGVVIAMCVAGCLCHCDKLVVYLIRTPVGFLAQESWNCLDWWPLPCNSSKPLEVLENHDQPLVHWVQVFGLPHAFTLNGRMQALLFCLALSGHKTSRKVTSPQVEWFVQRMLYKNDPT